MDTSKLQEVRDLLMDISEYLEDREDADIQGDPPRYVPNRAMRLNSRVKEVVNMLDDTVCHTG